MVRMIGDGGMSFYIKDFAVIPSYQSKGVGTLLLNALEDYIKENIARDWAVSLELISSKEAVLFYQKHGFEERPCLAGNHTGRLLLYHDVLRLQQFGESTRFACSYADPWLL
jgi:ribosomal protein S18 acetylase RimI-like enzyme